MYDNLTQLGEAVCRLANDRALVATLGKVGRAGRDRYYTEHAYVERYLALVSSIQASKGLGVSQDGRRAVVGG